MPTIPKSQALKKDGIAIQNAVVNEVNSITSYNLPNVSASGNGVTVEESLRSLNLLGSMVQGNEYIRNAYLDVLVNRVALTWIKSRMYRNPWASLKKGILEYGEVVQEIFVNMAKPFDFNQEDSEQTMLRREIPDVRAQYHIMNYQKYYKVSITEPELKQAFLSADGVYDLIEKIIETLWTGANYDEFLVMKYMFARAVLLGYVRPVTVGALTPANANHVVASIKGETNLLQFMSTENNYAGVSNYTDIGDLYIMLDAKTDAFFDVEVLASAFNMDKAEFFGRRILVDSFSKFDTKRLDELFGNDPLYQPFTEDEIKILEGVVGFAFDKDWYMIFDNLVTMRDFENGQGLYWQHWLHCWKTFSISKFSNALVFVTDEGAVTGITITPASASLMKGSTLQLNINYTSTGAVDKKVTWDINSTVSTVTADGLVTISPQETETSLTVTATLDSNPEITATCTLTIV